MSRDHRDGLPGPGRVLLLLSLAAAVPPSLAGEWGLLRGWGAALESPPSVGPTFLQSGECVLGFRGAEAGAFSGSANSSWWWLLAWHVPQFSFWT